MRRNRIYEATIDDRTMRVAAANQQTALDLLSNAFPDATIGLTTVKDGNGKPVLPTDAGILDDLPTHDDGDADGALEGLAGTAAEYVRRHRSERQSTQLTSRQTVTLTIIQNQCATGTGRDPLDINTAPQQVMDAIETTGRGHELFDRMHDRADGTIVYGLRRMGE